MAEKQRCFIALDLPKEMIDELKKIQEQIRKEDLFTGKFTEEVNLHLTLKFFGSITNDEVKKIQEKLRNIKFKSFTAGISEIGVFSEEFIRIIWVTLNGKEVLEIQSLVDAALSSIFPKENRFMSHITVARVKNVKDKEKLLNYIKKFKIKEFSGKITSFSLVSSTLKPTGAEYKVIEKYKLS
jgi:2'-5' RNA ligase